MLQSAFEARDRGDLCVAVRLLERLANESSNDPEPLHHLGVLYERQGRLAEAEAAFRRALELAPGAEGTQRLLAILLLSQGRYREGFPLSEARHALGGMAKPALPFPEWRGEPIAGKRLLIWPEQGFGDQIQFARFAPVLKGMGADVTLLCAPPLARLFGQSLDVRVIAASGETSFPDPDYWVMTCSIAGRLGVETTSIPDAPYLRADEAATDLPDGLKIGIAWRGNPANMNDAHRSLPLEAAEKLRELPGAVIELDPASTGAKDFADTAAIMAELDLVVAVDTSVAHLAGAMGKPCWVLLSATRTDWRWMRERSDSPWYPSLRLYRQETAGDWTPVLDRVLNDARQLL